MGRVKRSWICDGDKVPETYEAGCEVVEKVDCVGHDRGAAQCRSGVIPELTDQACGHSGVELLIRVGRKSGCVEEIPGDTQAVADMFSIHSLFRRL